MLRKITYTDKEDILGLTAVDNKNKVTAQDMNDIKNAINDNTDELDKIKVNKSGSDMTGALNFAQNVWNKFGSNVAVGAINTAGTLGIIGLDGTTGVHLIPKNGNNNEGVTWSCDVDGNSTMSGTLNGSFKGPLNGNAATTTKLQTARTINGTSFDGTANIITNAWGTARDITLGLTKKSVNGSTNMSWTLAEMGALPAAGGTMTGSLIVEKPVTFKDTLTVNGVTDLNNVLNVTGATALKSTLDVTGATTLKSTLGVTGATTLGSTLSVTGIATLKNDTNINGALSVDKATTLKNTLNVTGITTLKNNAIINGTLSVDGATSLKNTLGVAGATTLGSTLDVTGVSTFTGNSIFKNNATVNGVLTVGGVTNLNNVLNVTGATALKSTLDVTGATTLGSTLSVTGDTVLKSNATVKGDLTVEGATTFNDELNITGDTTIDGALNITGATILGSTLDVTGIATFKNNTNINGTLSVDKATTLKNTLNVTGATTLGSTLNVTGITTLKNNAIINGALSVDGATSLKNTLGVTGATTLGSTLSVTGIATLKNDTNINGALSVDKATTLKNTLGVTGATTLSNTLTVSGITNLNNALNVTGATALKSTLGVTGATTLNDTLDVTKATTLKDTLGVTGATTLGSTLGVTGATSLKSTLGVTGATTLSNTLTVSGITNLNNALNVTGATALKSTLGVTGVATFNDNSSFKKNINIDGVLNSSLTTGTHLQGNQGKAIINSTATAGSYTMLAKMNSTNGYFTTGTHNGGYLLQYTAKSTVDAGTNAVTKSVTLLDESGNATFPERVTAKEFYGTFIGNSSTVTKLQTARKINDTSFDGTADITTTKWGTARNIYIADSDATNTGTAVSVNGSGNATLKLPATIKATLTGNASTATTLQTSRKINGTNFNGSADITTDKWGTARNINISDATGSNTGADVSVNGGTNATLKLPSTIVATLSGNASSATKATKDGDGNVITSTYRKISDSYTKNEIDNKFSTLETAIDWKESVATFSDIAKKYPTPDDGWTVNVKDTDYTYRYNGKQWVAISANAIPKVTGSVDGLMTTDLYNKLVGIQNNATKITVDTKMSTSSTNPVQNKVVQSALDTKLNTSGGTITGALTVNGGITGSLTGNASTATKLATARTISLTGSVTGSGTFDGSGNLSIATTTNHTHSYLPLSGGTMGSAAYISWPDSGNWSNNNSGVTFPVDRGGFNWSGQSDGIKLYAEETSNDNLELVLKFADDDSNGLSIRNSLGKQTARISASGVFTGSFSGNASTATKLATARTINGTSFDGSANITTANWGTARNIYIADSDATNTGAAVSVNGSGNATLKLPATIKASLTGNASTASALQDYNSTSNTIQIGYSGSSLTSSEVAYLAAYKSGGKQIKDVPVSTVKTLMGIKNSKLNVTCSSSNWSGSAAPYTNTINVTGVTASNIVEVGLNNASATDAQVQACMKASIAKITQENGKIKLYAYGTKPTVNIPMTVVILTT